MPEPPRHYYSTTSTGPGGLCRAIAGSIGEQTPSDEEYLVSLAPCYPDLA